MWAICFSLVLVGVYSHNDQLHPKKVSATCTCQCPSPDPFVQDWKQYNFTLASATGHHQVEAAPFKRRQGSSPARSQDVGNQSHMEMCQLHESLRQITSVLWSVRSVLAYLCRSDLSQQCKDTAGNAIQEGTMDICQQLGSRHQLDGAMGSDAISMVQLAQKKADTTETAQSEEAQQSRPKTSSSQWRQRKTAGARSPNGATADDQSVNSSCRCTMVGSSHSRHDSPVIVHQYAGGQEHEGHHVDAAQAQRITPTRAASHGQGCCHQGWSNRNQTDAFSSYSTRQSKEGASTSPTCQVQPSCSMEGIPQPSSRTVANIQRSICSPSSTWLQ